jgi:hemoglobin-like flavoprotein
MCVAVMQNFSNNTRSPRGQISGHANTLFLEWNHAAHAVMIGGTSAVSGAVEAIAEKHAAIATDAIQGAKDGKDPSDAWGDAYKVHAAELNKARDVILEEMRKDVAPSDAQDEA